MESTRKRWATRSSTRSLARTAHSFAWSTLLALFARSIALTRSFASSWTHSRSGGKVSDFQAVLSHSASWHKEDKRRQWVEIHVHLNKQNLKEIKIVNTIAIVIVIVHWKICNQKWNSSSYFLIAYKDVYICEVFTEFLWSLIFSLIVAPWFDKHETPPMSQRASRHVVFVRFSFWSDVTRFPCKNIVTFVPAMNEI